MSIPFKILLVTNDDQEAALLLSSFRARGGRVLHSACGDSAVECVRHGLFDLVLLCACAPGRDGIRTLLQCRALAPDTPLIILTEHQQVDTAVEAMRLGAFDYVVMPTEMDTLHHRVDRALEQRRLTAEVVRLRAEASGNGATRLVGESRVFADLLALMSRVAMTSVPVLLTGETGSGKELVAREIHAMSARRTRPFMPISCAALTDTLLESELFGHLKGSFTGAVSNRPGLIQEAQGGTVFLDEIETLGIGTQSKLLRVVEEKTIQPVGGRHDIPVDFRLIAASNTPLDRLVERNDFRQDLYFRLNVFPINVPPLRDRPTDIPLLAEYFRDRFARETGLPAADFDPDSMSDMLGYDWPGNVRELRHCVERAMIQAVSGGPLCVDVGGSACGYPLFGRAVAEGWSLSRVEREYVAAVLSATRGNRSRAARVLGINRSTLYDKLGDRRGRPRSCADPGAAAIPLPPAEFPTPRNGSTAEQRIRQS